MALRCPRCSTFVDPAPGQKPVCPTCGYPGPDARATPTGDWRDGRFVPDPSPDRIRTPDVSDAAPQAAPVDARTAGTGAGTGTWTDAGTGDRNFRPEMPAGRGTGARNIPAIWALVLGIAGFILLPLALFTAIGAIVLGAIGLGRAGETGTGKGMAGTGLGLGIAQVVIVPILLAAVVFVLVQGLGDIQEDRAEVTVVLEDGDALEELVVYASVFEDGNTTTCDCRMTIVLEEGDTRRELFSGPVAPADFGTHAEAPGDGRAARFVFDRDLPCDEETHVRLEVQEGARARTASTRVC